MTTAYSRRDDAITREIIEPLGEWAEEHDIGAIADHLIICDGTGLNPEYSLNPDADFWGTVAIYDTMQIQQALGVQGDCETTIISKQDMERLEARLKEAEKSLSNRAGACVAADVVRRASMSILAGDAERDLMRRYIVSSTRAQDAIAGV